MSRPMSRVVEWAVILLLLGAGVLYWQTHHDRMVTLTPGIHLSWDGRGWALLDGRDHPGLEGGIVVVQDLSGVRLHAGTAVIGREAAGRFFILPLGKGDYLDTKWFTSEPEWRAACEALGIASPTLASPDAAGG